MPANTQNFRGISKFRGKNHQVVFKNSQSFKNSGLLSEKVGDLLGGKFLVAADGALSTGGSKGFGDNGNDSDGVCVEMIWKEGVKSSLKGT